MGKSLLFNFSLLLTGCILFSGCSHGDRRSGKEPGQKNKEALGLELVSSFRTGEPGASSAEISAYDPASKKLFVVNSIARRLDVVDLKNPKDLHLLRSVSILPYGGAINSVTVKKGIVAVAVENHERQLEGFVCFFNTNGDFIKKVTVGVQPDMLTFTPDGKKILVANEGEPNEDYTIDPEGSISIIDISSDINALGEENVSTLDFRKYNDSLAPFSNRGIRITGPNASVAQDLEPEYIAIAPDGRKAYVTLQENNAVAVIDIGEKKITAVHSLGESTFRLSPDGSCQVKGFYQPDGITAFEVNNSTYLITANEGDIRKFPQLKESIKLKHKAYMLDPARYPDQEVLKDKERLGKTQVARSCGDTDGDGDIDEIYCFGTRSFTIWDTRMHKVFDSGNDFEKYACRDRQYCSLNECYEDEENNGSEVNPQPESIATGKVGKNMYAFITLERFGGMIVYNISDPGAPHFVTYTNNRTEQQSRPEGILFIPANENTGEKSLIIVANEGTSTIDVYEAAEQEPRQGAEK